jgi:DNA-directed RNA polymerase specialized sigma24 family protein
MPAQEMTPSATRHPLAMLPARQRAVLVLRYYADLSEADIADILGCSRGTAKARPPRPWPDHERHPRFMRRGESL